MSPMILTVLTACSGLALLVSCGLTLSALGRLRPVGSLFWVAALCGVLGTGAALVTGLRATALASTVDQLIGMPLVPVGQVKEVPSGTLVAVQGIAKATGSAQLRGRRGAAAASSTGSEAPPEINASPPPPPEGAAPADPSDPANAGAGILAVEVHYTGEDEVEGEENDYIKNVDYGRESDLAPFQLLGGDKPLVVDEDGFKVLADGTPEQKQVDTNEYSAVLGRNLVEYESKATIPDGARIVVSGVLVDQGAQRVLLSAGPALSLLTNRPWEGVLDRAREQRGNEERSFLLCLVLALLTFGFHWWVRPPQEL